MSSPFFSTTIITRLKFNSNHSISSGRSINHPINFYLSPFSRFITPHARAPFFVRDPLFNIHYPPFILSMTKSQYFMTSENLHLSLEKNHRVSITSDCEGGEAGEDNHCVNCDCSDAIRQGTFFFHERFFSVLFPYVCSPA